MSKKMIWGLGVLVLLIGTAFVFVTLRDRAEIRQLEKELAAAKELEKHMNQQPSADNKPPQEAKDGFEWEWHGDHWHEMPIAQAPQQTPIVQPAQPVQAKTIPRFTKPLTFHKELLETNPLEALRLQCKERGHWSAKWIAEFSSDNHQAQALARTVYLNLYYDSLYQSTGEIPISDAEYNQLGAELDAHIDALFELPINHQAALIKVTWPFLTQDNEPILIK